MQIGPRIRVGGTVGKIGEAIKHNIPSVGNMAGNAAMGLPGAIAGSLLGGGTNQLRRDIGVGARNAAAVLPVVGGAGGVAGAAGAAGGAASAAGSASRASRILDAIGKYGPLVLGGLSAYEGYQDNKRAQELQDRAIQLAEENAAARTPLREMGMAGLKSATRPDLSAIYADSGNPYARKRIPVVGGSR